MTAYYLMNFRSANNADLRQSFALTDSASTPVNLTGSSLKMHIEVSSNGTTLEVSTGNGRIALVNAAAGQFDIAVPAVLMHTLPEGIHQHDLLLTLPSGQVQRIWAGTLTLARGVTT